MRVLVLSNMYPKGDSYFGGFVKEQVADLERNGVKIIKVVKSNKSRVGYFPFFLRSVYYLLFKDYELVHAHYGFHSALPALIFKRVPLLVTYHRGDALEEPQRNLIYHWLQRLTVKRASYIIAISQEIKEVLISKLGASESRISVISCGVNTEIFKPYKNKQEPRKELGLPEQKPIVLFPGPLSHRKGIDIVQRCASALHGVIFVLLGKAKDERRKTKNEGGSNCILVGFRPHHEIPKWLNAADIFFLPSRSEGVPVSLLEALSCGLPVVASPVGGIVEVIKDGENGFLIEDVDSIISKITELVRDKDKRDSIGKGARESIKRFDKNKIADKIKKVYYEVIK